ncbi:tyrosine-protein phosphatase [Hugenholtzia roseola]|uniref:tyrosine-protein phosphatase n=1 Tax=Hugenholtzia roseola TaxID=1002 RepID=UPI0004229FC6|nr:CpsB/CapC family capsule biosynthesis tyrosine phosphatase [Hugenholtzia roseola]
MISLFKRKLKSYGMLMPLQADMHSHLLPALDDGCANFEQSIALVKEMIELGYKKLILTPHIMQDFYRNSPEGILQKLDQLQDLLRSLKLEIELEAAAEYYLDEHFFKKIEKNEPLLTFGKERYLLFETSYMNPSPYLKSAIFLLRASGYTPILAHPERYVYWYNNPKEILELEEQTGVLLQININSLVGYYSTPAKKIAEMLIDAGKVHFLGTDCHNQKHLEMLKKARASEYYAKALQLPLLNNKLIDNPYPDSTPLR